jgi:hypothetical protein
MACRLQKLIEPLCETHDQVHTPWTQESLERYRSDVLIELAARGVFSEALIHIPQDKQGWNDWLALADSDMTMNSQLKHMATHRELLKGEFTLANRIGLGAWKLFSVGTKCTCCYGWRLLFASAIGFTAARFI